MVRTGRSIRIRSRARVKSRRLVPNEKQGHGGQTSDGGSAAREWIEQWRAQDGQLPSMRRCPSCFMEMPEQARKCTKCEYAGGRLDLVTLAPILSLVVALISVLVTALPTIQRTVTPKFGASTQIADVDDAQTFEIALGNSGQTSFILDKVDITIQPRRDVGRWLNFHAIIEPDKFQGLSSRNFRSNDTHLITAKIQELLFDDATFPGGGININTNFKCVLSTEIFSSTGSHILNKDFDCHLWAAHLPSGPIPMRPS